MTTLLERLEEYRTALRSGKPNGEYHDECCIGGWMHEERYGWVICAEHENESADNGQPDDKFIDYFRAWQPLTNGK